MATYQNQEVIGVEFGEFDMWGFTQNQFDSISEDEWEDLHQRVKVALGFEVEHWDGFRCMLEDADFAWNVSAWIAVRDDDCIPFEFEDQTLGAPVDELDPNHLNRVLGRVFREWYDSFVVPADANITIDIEDATRGLRGRDYDVLANWVRREMHETFVVGIGVGCPADLHVGIEDDVSVFDRLGRRMPDEEDRILRDLDYIRDRIPAHLKAARFVITDGGGRYYGRTSAGNVWIDNKDLALEYLMADLPSEIEGPNGGTVDLEEFDEGDARYYEDVEDSEAVAWIERV